MAFLEINSLVKKFSETTALNDVSLRISDGEMVGIIGKSGAGKSTLMRLINRLIEPTSGSISYDGVEITSLKRKNLRQWRSKCAMIFQQFNLIDRLDVLTNVLSGTLGINFNLLKLFKFYSKKEKIEALTYLNNLDLSDKALQRVETLSGGQQQRVGIARSLAVEPDIWFLDEPFSALDPLIRKEMQDEFLRLQDKLQKTIMFITHDFDEALKLADRIAIMKDGIIEQLDTPANIVLNPATEYVRKFTEEVPREKVLLIEDVMEPSTTDNLGDLKVLKDEIIENVAEKILTQEKSVAVIDNNNKIVGSINPTKIINTVFGGRKNNN